jgi:hypothetical protein
MEQLKLQMRLLPLHMGAATAPSIPHALQMELLKPKLSSWQMGLLPLQIHSISSKWPYGLLDGQKSSPIFSSFLIK